ncbi:electron transport complex subunit RsxC [Aliivibrio fischeri]|uniref:electron transport complex subunit RsxC n=2 Tax=Aliivibrio fischeri TaxID=668 RepID=UPI00209171A4|nr:electron transport complex subunit RsxC [Aliivibrio fischeri]USR96390.1 electron transport complex subunit RsxC [Aliivibrio fischeri ATCC 7744 = JCM 18803 = DSM 507]
MLSIIEQIKQGQLWDFHGGIHPEENKTISNQVAIQQAGIPSQLVLPLKQHIGGKGDILVSVGDVVLKGQPLTQGNIAMCVPVHAPTSGKITAIEPRTVAHPSGLTDLCIVIESDGEDRWIEDRTPIDDFASVDPIDLIERIRQSGISGMGGAGFPTSRKIQSGIGKAEMLIINAAECEPYITADDRLMREHAEEIIDGIKILQHILTPKVCIIAIEDNKPEAVKALNQAVNDHDNIIIRVIPTKYPSGGSRQLTKIITGQEVPANGRSTDIGVIVQNVGTVFAIKRAICNAEPLIERVVTLTGNSMSTPGNLWVRLGTCIDYLMDLVSYKADKKHPRIIMGGSLMGFTLPHQQVPITKITNCIITPDKKELPLYNHEMACIRCSSCADACPTSLLPQQLYWYSKSEDYDKCNEYHLDDCIECGACAYVCPSEIPLVQYYRQAKSEIYSRKQDELAAERAKLRFEEKNARLERDKLERENKFKQAAENRRKEMKTESKGGDDAIAAAIARVKAQKAAQESGVAAPKPAVAAAIARAKAKQAEAAKSEASVPDNSEMAKLREERKQQARERKAKLAEETTVTDSDKSDKKDAVAAAIARAKARKAAQAEEKTEAPVTSEENNQNTEESADPKKAAVAAAIARAKARKAAQAEEKTETPVTSEENNQSTEESVDPKKAAVAAAIARAKARKAAQAEEKTEAPVTSEENNQNTEESADPKKAAVAAAIARAKARKAAQAEEKTETPVASEENNQNTEESVDPKKAAVAAAIARAKARKAAQAEEKTETPVASEENNQNTEESADPKKAAVAAAIARAKARKAAQENNKKEE